MGVVKGNDAMSYIFFRMNVGMLLRLVPLDESTTPTLSYSSLIVVGEIKK